MRTIALLLTLAATAHAEYKVNPYTNLRDYYETNSTSVKLTGTQTIAGDKTFTGSITLTGSLSIATPGLHEPGDFKWKISQSSSCGSGWLRADGSSKSTTTYSALFAQMGYMFGGSTNTFTLPDMNNGEFVRAVSTGTAGGNLTLGMGSKQADEVKAHTHTADIWGTNNLAASGGGNQMAFGRSSTVSGSYGGTETRPRNYAMIPCIYSGVP